MSGTSRAHVSDDAHATHKPSLEKKKLSKVS